MAAVVSKIVQRVFGLLYKGEKGTPLTKLMKISNKSNFRIRRHCIYSLPIDVITYLISVRYENEVTMDTVSVNKFRENLKFIVEHVATEHSPLKVTRRSGEGVVVSADDWDC